MEPETLFEGLASRHVDWFECVGAHTRTHAHASRGAFRLRVQPCWPSRLKKSEQPGPTATPARAIIRIHGAREIKLTPQLTSRFPPSAPSCFHFDLQHCSPPRHGPPPKSRQRRPQVLSSRLTSPSYCFCPAPSSIATALVIRKVVLPTNGGDPLEGKCIIEASFTGYQTP